MDGSSLPARMILSANAGMGAACFCHPFDVVRVQMQTASTIVQPAGMPKLNVGVTGVVSQILKRDGVLGMYNGLSAAFLRQWMYGSGRMGIYSFLLTDFKSRNNNKAPNFGYKLSFGLISGGIGAFCGTPAEVAIVRMCADKQLPEAERRNYKHVVDCVLRIAKEEGYGGQGLFRGASVTVLRAMALASVQLAVVSETKEYLVRNSGPSSLVHFTDAGLSTTVVSSMVASVFANGASLPFDVVKSRIQNMPMPQPGAPPMFDGMLDCARKSISKEGVLVLWKGFTPALVKLTPYTVLSLTFLEQLTLLVTGKPAL